MNLGGQKWCRRCGKDPHALRLEANPVAFLDAELAQRVAKDRDFERGLAALTGLLALFVARQLDGRQRTRTGDAQHPCRQAAVPLAVVGQQLQLVRRRT